MKTDTLKRGTAFFAVLLLIGVWCLSAGTLYSSAKSFSEMNDDAYVTDGSRGDRPGILGDENDARRDDAARTPAGALGGRENGQGNGGSGLTGGDIPGNTAEGDFTDGAAGGIGGDQPGNAGGNGSAVLGAQDFDDNTDGAGDPARRLCPSHLLGHRHRPDRSRRDSRSRLSAYAEGQKHRTVRHRSGAKLRTPVRGQALTIGLRPMVRSPVPSTLKNFRERSFYFPTQKR